METKILLITLLFIILYVINGAESRRYTPGIDSDLHEDILDSEECDRQIKFIRSNNLLGIQFADAGLRIPRGILTGNVIDLGNYHQCLGINHQLEGMQIQGKYCSILVPFDQYLDISEPNDVSYNMLINRDTFNLDKETIETIDEYNSRNGIITAITGEFDAENTRTFPEGILSGRVFRLAVCIPKPCSTQQAVTSLLFNISEVGFQYTEDFCRIPNDKPWSVADTMFVVIFSLIGLLTLLSSTYDICARFIIKKDLKEINPIHQSFSIYTNGQRLMNFSTSSGNMQCLDGIRTIAMMWVILGHSFGTELFSANPSDSGSWIFSARALWVTSAPITVDTFFTLSGMLLVYSTAGKMNSAMLLKNLHWFYLNRVVRIYPLLAIAALLQASYFNWIFDGPFWWTVAGRVERCRRNWWSTLLNVQNYIHRSEMCIGHTWYIAIDMQLYIFSPLVLYWVFKGKRWVAWTSLFTALFGILIASTAFNFIKNLPAGSMVPSRPNDSNAYMWLYYFNALTRGAPFFVGMTYGYLLNIYRGRKVQLPWYFSALLWLCTAATLGTIFYCESRIRQFDWDNQVVDNLMNSYMRPMWAACICWLIFACIHGYAGPLNWFLSLDIWRLPARLSYGMYLFHYPLMFTINGTEIAPVYFSVAGYTFKFLSHLTLAVIVSFILTLLVDAPIYFLFKRMIDSVQRKRKQLSAVTGNDTENIKEGPRSGTSTEVQIDEHKTQ